MSSQTITDHGFIGVFDRPDQNECTLGLDVGSDHPYCGQTAEAHGETFVRRHVSCYCEVDIEGHCHLCLDDWASIPEEG